MQLVNASPFQIGYAVGRLRHPKLTLTIVVKATFDLVDGGIATPSAEQQGLLGDVLVGDEESGSLRYEADLAPFKPRADLLLVGHVRAAEPVRMVDLSFRVGSYTKLLRVFGDREWRVSGATLPEPFTRMPLVYERSFGGPSVPQNPVGLGDGPRVDAQGRTRHWLPNIEHPRALVSSELSRPAPSGFGPLRRTWAPRNVPSGSFGGGWTEARWPWLPDDFDFGYYNAAPADMQVPYLRGDETLELTGFHPDRRRLTTRLPGVRVRCFVRPAVDDAQEVTPGFTEIALNLDTLHVDTDTDQVVLLWRGLTVVSDVDLSELGYLIVVPEAAGEPARSVEGYERWFEAQLAEAEEETAEPESPQPETVPEPEPDFEAEIAAAQAQSDAALRAQGMDPDAPVDPEVSLKDLPPALRAVVERALKEMEPPEPKVWTRDEVARVAGAGGSLRGEMLEGLDLSGLSLKGVDLHSAVLKSANLAGAMLEGAVLERADLSGADLTGANLMRAELREADLSAVTLHGANLRGAVVERALLERASAHDADLSDVSGEKADLSRADLTRASLRGAKMPGALFTEALLEEACLASATLSNADFGSVRGSQVDAQDAVLEGLRASKACLPGLHARGAEASGSVWSDAQLERADFRFAKLADANFSGANLEAADLSATVLRSAKLGQARLLEARLLGADLFEADLERANLTRCDCTAANLFGAELFDAITERAVLAHANLNRTKLAR
jgi:uncharacterized protein YjbI with pentapeptide repeats